MIAALGTLTFLATLWLLAVVGAAMLEESGARIAAALKGPSPEPLMPVVPFERRRRRVAQAPMRGERRWRAAA